MCIVVARTGCEEFKQFWETESIILQRKANKNKHKKCKIHMAKPQPLPDGFHIDHTCEQHLDITISQIHEINSLAVQKAKKENKT